MIATMKSGWERLRERGLPAVPEALGRNLLPLVLLALGLTAVLMLFLWSDQAGYKPVFGAREKIAAADMMSVLDAEQVPYRVHPESGQVLVPEKQLGKVRMLLAAKGVTARLPAGLELTDRNDPLGVSQFVQDIRFRRGLEGELAQSIQALDAVESARVHLSIARSSSFVLSDGAKSSASVMLALKPGRQLVPEQIAAVVKLVSGSVADLDPQRVSLVDQAGNLLSARVDLSHGFEPNGGNEAAKHYQEATLRSVRELLAPVLGQDNFKATVTAEIDDDRVEETQEKFGSEPRVTSEAVRDEQDRGGLPALGVPGSLSNRPATAAPAPPGEASSARKNATTRQYAYDRSVKQIKRSRGRLAQLGVAVVLNNAAAPKDGAWTKEELSHIENILRNGLGIHAERGDKLVVSALSFPAAAEPVAWWKRQDTVLDVATPLAYLVGGVLAFFFVLRPLMRTVQTRLAAPAAGKAGASLVPLSALEGPGSAGAGGSAAGAAAPALGHDAMPVVPLLENYDLPPPGSPVDVMVNHLRVLASKEPERVAEVVKQWVQKNGRRE